MKEEEIRPEKIFDEYLRLAKIDVEIFFKGVYSQDIPCPAHVRAGCYGNSTNCRP